MNKCICISEEDIINSRQIYTQECPLCTLSINVITQRDDFPEYEAQVYVQCQCGNYIEFILPVN